MSKTKKIVATLGIILLVTLIGSGIYVNQMLGKLALDINDTNAHSQEVKIEATKDNNITDSGNNASNNDSQLASDDFNNNNESNSINEPSSKPTEDNQKEDQNGSISNGFIISEVEKKLNQPIEKSDILKAGTIIMKKLSASEIVYLFGFSDGDYTKEELFEAREILLAKLSSEDIRILQSIARNYGKSLRILDANIEIQ